MFKEKCIQILHLEDDAADAELIQAILDSTDITSQITRVQTSTDFSEALSKGGYDLILADYQLPSYNGLSALNLVRDRYPDIPFIFVSGTLGEDAAINALTEGAVDYVTKQKLSRLAPAIRRALNETENRIKRRQAEDALQKNNALLERIFSSTEFLIAYLDADFNFIRVNRAYAEADNRTPEFFIGKNHFDLYPDAENESIFRRVVETGDPYIVYAKPYTYPEHPERGTTYWNWTLQPIKELDGNISGLVFSLVNVTEREKAIIAQRESDALYRTLIEQASDGIFVADPKGNYVDVNPSGCAMLGYGREEILHLNMSDLASGETQRQKPLQFDELRSGKSITSERTLVTKSGSLLPVEISGKVLDNGNLLGIVRDITERRQAQEEHKTYVRFLESMDKVNRAMQRSENLKQMMDNVLDVVLAVFDCDRAFILHPCDPNALSWTPQAECTRPEYPGAVAMGIHEIPLDADVADAFRILLNTDGPVKFGPGNSHPLPANVSERFSIKSLMSMALFPKVGKPWEFGIHQCSHERIWTPEDERLFHEIGRHLSDVLTSFLTYDNLQESEERYRQLVNLSPDSIVVYTQGRVVFVNPATVKMTGVKSEEELIGRPILDFVPPELRESVAQSAMQIQANGGTTPFVEAKLLRADGTIMNVDVALVSYQQQGVDYIQIVTRDITGRKRHELEREAIITVSTALRKATTKAEILTVILDKLVELFDADGSLIALPNPETKDIVIEMGRGVVGERFSELNIPQGRGISGWVIENKKPYLNNYADADPFFHRPDLLGDSTCVAAVPLIAQEQSIGALWVVRRTIIMEQELRLLVAIADIAANAIHRVMLHEQTVQQLHRILALHQIDLAISANFDLNVTLNVILKNVKDELAVDAASILLLDNITHTLDYAAGIGFRSRHIEQSHVKFGTGCAGRAAQEYRTVSYSDLHHSSDTASWSPLLTDEGFLLQYATPLIVKGQVKGVLETFHRTMFEVDTEWIDYFETLATQAAIAIENASLFENLQRSNMELTLAYDATIEGWSRALDLRDRETEGHTQRVTEMVLELAERLGMSDTEKANLRRGSLLHDIGKMGVPDSILLKPGPLSEHEWEIMRQHPAYAFQMLSPINYLRRALDIPYCHHERWDGSGYPRGLTGESIPLFARLFAVVDVFDALTSDRPYRSAWSREKVRQYIQQQAGRHFDPQIVKVFLEIME